MNPFNITAQQLQGIPQRKGPPKFNDKVPKGYRAGAIQQFTPEQMDLFQQLFGNLGPDSYLSRLAGGDESLFEEIEAPALRQFGGIQGNLASRFTGFGGQGSLSSRRSSGFQNSMNAAGSDFAQQLQANRQNLQRQAISDLMGFSNKLLSQRPYERVITEKQKPWWQSAASGFVQNFANSAGKQLGQNIFSGGSGGGVPGGGAPVPVG